MNKQPSNNLDRLNSLIARKNKLLKQGNVGTRSKAKTNLSGSLSTSSDIIEDSDSNLSKPKFSSTKIFRKNITIVGTDDESDNDDINTSPICLPRTHRFFHSSNESSSAPQSTISTPAQTKPTKITILADVVIRASDCETFKPYVDPVNLSENINMQLEAEESHGKDRIEAKAPTPMQEIDDALKACTFGRFHIQMLATALVGLVASVLVSNSTAYLLPNAECDLHMDLVEKGMLNAMPYIGMMLSSLIAGFLTDTFGRRLFLISGYGGIFVFTLLAGSSQTYEVLLTAKFFEGIFFATSFSPTVTYTSEFCHKGIRDRVMLSQSSFAAFSQVLIAAMSWGILTNDWKYSLFGGYIVLNTWNFYLYLMSLWSLAACVLYFMLPESPKFLITQQRYDEARDIVIKTYVMNTGKQADTFPYPNLWKTAKQQVIDESPEHKDASLSHQLVMGLYNVKPMFKMPLALPLSLISLMGFLVMALYNVYRLWFPQLSTVVEHYSVSGDHGDLCGMLDAYTHDLRNRNVTGENMYVCVPTLSGAETYINSMIVGGVCFLPYPIMGMLVNKVGKKALLFCAGVICVCATLGLRWADTKGAVVALFSLDIAVSQTMISLFQALTVEVFPTTVRTLAISVVMLVGRTGTLAGNIMFPILLNMGCVVPFYGFTGLMILVSALSLFLPAKKK